MFLLNLFYLYKFTKNSVRYNSVTVLCYNKNIIVNDTYINNTINNKSIEYYIKGYDERFPLIENNYDNVKIIFDNLIKFRILNYILDENKNTQEKINYINVNLDYINNINNTNEIKTFDISNGGLYNDFFYNF